MNKMSLEEYKGVFVFAQQVDNVLDGVAFELLGKGKDLAKDLNTEVTAESKTVYRALTIIVIGAVAAFGSAVVVYYNTAETVSVIDCIFESCSAFGTVGLSVGVTGQLNTGAKLLYMACMFMGRVGPVSLAISLTAKPDDNKRKVLPVGHINVG